MLKGLGFRRLGRLGLWVSGFGSDKLRVSGLGLRGIEFRVSGFRVRDITGLGP